MYRLNEIGLVIILVALISVCLPLLSLAQASERASDSWYIGAEYVFLNPDFNTVDYYEEIDACCGRTGGTPDGRDLNVYFQYDLSLDQGFYLPMRALFNYTGIDHTLVDSKSVFLSTDSESQVVNIENTTTLDLFGFGIASGLNYKYNRLSTNLLFGVQASTYSVDYREELLGNVGQFNNGSDIHYSTGYDDTTLLSFVQLDLGYDMQLLESSESSGSHILRIYLGGKYYLSRVDEYFNFGNGIMIGLSYNYSEIRLFDNPLNPVQ